MDSKKSLESEIALLIPGFLKRRSEEVIELQLLIRENKYEEIAFIAHKLKGNGAAYGFPQISEVGIELETAAKQHDEPRARQLIEKLGALIQQSQGENYA